MSGPTPLGGGNPFEALFGELSKMLSSQGSVNLQIARQMALWLATEGQAEPNVDPLERMRYEELVRVADLHVSDATGLPTSPTGSMLVVRPVTRGEWAARTLDAYGPLMEGGPAATDGGAVQSGSAESGSADSGSADSGSAGGLDHDDQALLREGEDDAAEDMLGGIAEVMGPLLVGLQAGSLVGQLAQGAFGQYELPVPRPPSNEVVLVPRNIDDFARDWGLALDDVRLWVCISEIAHHAVLGQPHVRQRMETLLRRYAGGFSLDLTALEEKLGDLDPRDPSSFQSALGDPGQLLSAMKTPGQHQVVGQMATLVAVVEGYVDHVLDTVGTRLIGSSATLSEALRRRRVERGEVTRLVEGLLGMELSKAQYERGAAFVRGVIERAGEEGLARLWRSERELPTPAEVDAPGLWLERIDLPE